MIPVVSARPKGTKVTWPRAISVAVVTVMVFGLWALRWQGPIDLRYDAAVYYVLGTSLASGQGYRIISEPGAPADIQYPPLLPALIAVHQRVLGTSDSAVVGPWLRWTYAVMFLGYGLAVLALARAHVRPWLALLATILCLGQTNTLLFSDLLFTELPFALVCVGFAWVLGTRRLADYPRTREGLAFALAAAGFLLRTAGVALLATFVIDALLRRKWRVACMRAVMVVLPVVCWQAYVWRVESGEEFRHPAYAYQRADYQFYNVTYAQNMTLLDPFRPELGRVTPAAWVSRLRGNLAILPAVVGEAVSESIGFWRVALRGEQEKGRRTLLDGLARIPLYLLAGFVFTGGVVLMKRQRWTGGVFVVVSIVLACSTPWPEQLGRYFTPLIPFFTIAVVVGIAAVYGFLRVQPRSRVVTVGRIALVGFCAVVVSVQTFAASMVFHLRHYEPATSAPGLGLDAPRWFYYGASWADWEKAVRWVGSHSDRNDIVVTASPHLCYLWTGLRAVMPPMEIDPEKARRLLETVPASWVIVDELNVLEISQRYARPAVESDPANWRLVNKFGGAQVYQRMR